MSMESGDQEPYVRARPERLKESLAQEVQELQEAIKGSQRGFDLQYAQELVMKGQQVLEDFAVMIDDRSNADPLGLLEEIRWEKKRLTTVPRQGSE